MDLATIWGVGWLLSALFVFLGKKHETGAVDEKIFVAAMMFFWPIIVPILFMAYLRRDK